MASEIRVIGNATEEDRMLNELMVSPVCTGFVEVGPDNFVLPNNYTPEVAKKYYNFQVRDEDIILAAHPKTGSTWLNEMVWLISNDLNYGRVETEQQHTRLPLLESDTIINMTVCGQLLAASESSIQFSEEVEEVLVFLNKMQNPRSIKSHLHWSLLPDQIRDGTKSPKIIVALRNPYDVCVSYYHHSKVMYKYTGTFSQFCHLFMAGRVYFAPYWKHVLSYWEQRHRSNILFVKYKDMKKDFPGVVKQVATFLGKTLTDQEVDKLTDYLSLENMKSNVHLNQEMVFESFYGSLQLTTKKSTFIRSGKEGGYKAEMSPEMIKKFDAWVEENIAGTGLEF